jgi:hypothetical protein
MNRRLLSIAIAAAGCTVTPPSVAFTTICSMPDAATCSFGDTCGAQILFPPVIDLLYTNELFLGIEAHNQAQDNSDPASGRINTHDAYVQEVDISYAGGALLIPSTATRMQQRVPANGTAVLGMLAIPASAGLTGASLGLGNSTQVIATVKGKGIYGDGSSFETPEFDILITICNNCLVGIVPTGCADPAQTPSWCPQAGQEPFSFKCQ